MQVATLSEEDQPRLLSIFSKLADLRRMGERLQDTLEDGQRLKMRAAAAAPPG